jgi:hypothetical protein
MTRQSCRWSQGHSFSKPNRRKGPAVVGLSLAPGGGSLLGGGGGCGRCLDGGLAHDAGLLGVVFLVIVFTVVVIVIV